MFREYPVFDLGVATPTLSVACDSLIDSGSDDTILPIWVAQRLGIDLTTAPQGDAHPVGSQPVTYRYATVELRISDGVEGCSWPAVVGFVDVPMRWGLLGRTGFLE